MFNDSGTTPFGEEPSSSSREDGDGGDSRFAQTSRELPLIVRQVGGALETVMSDLDNYTDDRYPIERVSQIAISRMIQKNPDLNNEENIAMLVDMFSFHGVSGADRTTLNKLLQDYPVESIHIAFEYLYEMGIRGQGTQASIGDPDVEQALLATTLQKIEEFQQSGVEIKSSEDLLARDWDVRNEPDFKDFMKTIFFDSDEDEDD